MPYTLTHISKGRGKTTLSFATLDEARIIAYRWRRSPKTRKVILGYTPDDTVQALPLLNPAYAQSNPTDSWFDRAVVWIDDKLLKHFRY